MSYFLFLFLSFFVSFFFYPWAFLSFQTLSSDARWLNIMPHEPLSGSESFLKTSEFHWWIPEGRMHRNCSWGRGRPYHARQRRHKERHKFAYLTMKNNSFACFAQAIFISVHFADAIVLSTKWNDLSWSCGDAVGIPWRMLILSSYLWTSCSNLLPG